MKIKRVEPIAVSLPMKKPVVMAGVEIVRADNVLVRIEANDGLVGWGEAASAPTMTGETVESMMAAIAYLAPALEGRPADDIAGALAAIAARMYANHGAKAAIEIALHDLVGRATNQPARSPPTWPRRKRRRRTATSLSRSRSASTRRSLTANAPAVCAGCSGTMR
jgi:L-alanine-DL-glutamate epimerase-like enolase superfamily enzyme